MDEFVDTKFVVAAAEVALRFMGTTIFPNPLKNLKERDRVADGSRAPPNKAGGIGTIGIRPEG